MTARDGISHDMDPFDLDAGTAERLVTGAVDVADAPPEYRAVARIFQALREAPDSAESVGEPAAVERISAAVVLDGGTGRAQPSRRSPSRVGRLALASAAALGLCVTGGLASAGALPEPAQNAASTVLGTVGISVPTGGDNPAVDAPPTPTPSPASSPATPGLSSPSAPDPDVAATAPDALSPTPGNTQGGADGTPTRGTPPETANGQGNPHMPNDPPKGADGKNPNR
jgi:hypothetical protein